MQPDSAADVLIHAFSGHGCTAYLGAPNTLIIRFPDGGKGSVDITEWRMFASRTPYPALPGHAAQWAQAVVYKQRTKNPGPPAPAPWAPPSPAPWAPGAPAHQSKVGGMIAAGTLRVRLYPEDAFGHPPGLREAMLVRPLAEGLVQAVAEDRPDSISPVNRVDLGGVPEHEAFGAGLRAAIDKEDHYVDRQEVRGFPFTVIGGQNRYVGARIHVLGRHVRPGRVGALVAFPLPEYIFVHEIGDKVIFEAMDILEDLARTFEGRGEKPISSKIFWWRPGRYEQLPEQQALSSGQVPDLRVVGVDMERNGNEVNVRTRNEATLELIDLWTREQQNRLRG